VQFSATHLPDVMLFLFTEHVPPGTIVPRVIPQLIKAVGLEGTTARMDWKVTGSPQPELQW